MFSICTKGIDDFLNLMPGDGTARLTSLFALVSTGARIHGFNIRRTHLQSATPSLRPSKRSADGSFSPKISSTQVRASFAAAGVYLSRRILRRSLSSDDTDAMIAECVVKVKIESRIQNKVESMTCVCILFQLRTVITRVLPAALPFAWSLTCSLKQGEEGQQRRLECSSLSQAISA